MINLNKEIISKISDDSLFTAEVCAFLETLAENELNKTENIDFDLIDACSDLIIELRTGKTDLADGARFLTAEQIMKAANSFSLKKLGVPLRVMVAAAVLIVSTISVNAAYRQNTGKSLFDVIAGIEKRSETTEAPQTEIITAGEEIITLSQTEQSEFSKISSIAEEETEEDDVIEGTKRPEIKEEEPAVFVDESEYVGKSDQPYEQNGKIVLRERSRVSNDAEKVERKLISSYEKKGTAPKLADFVPTRVSNYPEMFSQGDEEEYLEKTYGSQGLLYCDNNETPHDFTQWSVVKEPTCGEFGEKVKTCKKCNKEIRCPVKATGNHDFELIKVNKSDWISKCKVCKTQYNQNIARPKYFVLNTDTLLYTGKRRTPEIIAVLDENGYEIPKSSYYIDYKESPYGSNPYWYWLYVNFKSDYYTGIYKTMCLYFCVLPPQTVMRGITGESDSISVYWKSAFITEKLAKARRFDEYHYEVQYSESRDFSNSATVDVDPYTLHKTVKNLKSNTKYYVRVRLVLLHDDTKAYVKGPWSDVRSIVTKE